MQEVACLLHGNKQNAEVDRMRKRRYDVVVVGCGPAGAIAGKFAALNGAETLIVEEKRQIGFPVYDSMGIIYSKSEMEEVTGEEIESAAIYSRAGGLVYIAPSGKVGKPQILPDGVFVNRQLFEKSLAIGAVRSGAEIMLHARAVDLVREQGVVKGVVIRDGSESTAIPCSLVIAADGCYRQMGRLAGIELSGGVSAALGCEFAGVRSLGDSHNIDEIYLDDSPERLYRYAVPYGDDRFSIGCSVSRGAVKEKKSLRERLNDLIRHLEAIGKYDFSNASPVSMMSGGMGLSAAPRLASDGVILVGNAAGGPLYGSRWGGMGLMAGACWTGRMAGEIAAQAVKEGDVTGRSLDGRYKLIIDETIKEEKPRVLESLDTWRKIFTLGSEEQEQLVEQVGGEVAALHFYSKGALPLRSCLEPVQDWLRKRKG